MTNLAQAAPPRIRRRVPLLAWAALALAAVAVGVVLFLALRTGGDSAAQPTTRATAPGIRYDGGPEEGTRDPYAAAAPRDLRYDGGPEEGFADPHVR